MTERSLAQLEQAERMLAQVASAKEAVAVRDFAEAARVWAKKAKLGTASINHATTVKVRAERLIAEYVDWGQAAGEIATGERGRPTKASSEMRLSDLGLTYQAVHEARLLRDHIDDAQMLAASEAATERDRELTRADLLRRAQARQRETTPATDPGAIGVDPDLEDWSSADGRAVMLAGDFQKRLAELPDASVDLIVTDPPYPKESLPLWLDLAECAARVLGPRGLLFAWSGQIHLPQVMAHLDRHLQYGWVFALQMPGINSRIMGRHIVQGWKPVLAYSPGPWPSGEWGDDVLISPEAQKGIHRWQQHGAPARRLIERYCPPDGLVVDPFAGTGTFGWAALQSGRRFIGCEPDAGRFAEATKRLMKPANDSSGAGHDR